MTSSVPELDRGRRRRSQRRARGPLPDVRRPIAASRMRPPAAARSTSAAASSRPRSGREGERRGRRRVTHRGGIRGLRLPHRCQELVAAPWHRLHVLWALRGIVQRPPDVHHALHEHVVGHESARPQALHQLGLGHHGRDGWPGSTASPKGLGASATTWPDSRSRPVSASATNGPNASVRSPTAWTCSSLAWSSPTFRRSIVTSDRRRLIFEDNRGLG